MFYSQIKGLKGFPPNYSFSEASDKVAIKNDLLAF